MAQHKTTLDKDALEQLCLAELTKLGSFADTSAVEVTRLLGSRSGNWTVRRIRRAGIARRPAGGNWNHVGREVVEQLKKSWELRA